MATKKEATTCKLGETVIYDDGENNECAAIVSECDDNGVAGLHVLRKGKHNAIWTPEVPHYNQAKKGAHWKKAS